MKTSVLLITICMGIFAVLIAGCTSSPQTAPSITPTVITTPSPATPSTCGFTSCHGLDLACGPNPPQACTMEYQLGDKCRQYAYCITQNGTCQLGTTPQFDACKSCIQKCGGADAAEIFSCEEKC